MSMHRFYYSIAIIFSLVVFPRVVSAAVLAPDQEAWLIKHNKTLIVRPEKNYPPFSFVSSTPSIRPKGLAVDYLELVARKIGAQQTYLEAKPLATILKDIKSGKEGIVLVLSETDERDEYLYFSEPFITLPAVIVTRKDYKRDGKNELTLADFNAKQVAVASGYAVENYIKDNYQRIILEPVTDDEVGLQKLLLGEVDAAVMDLASLSYYTSHDMLSYVTVAGQTGFEYALSFAVPKTMPDLQAILNAGLKEITPSERSIIKDRWITFPTAQPKQEGHWALFSAGTPLWMGMSVAGAIIIVILLVAMIIHTRRHHRMHIASLSRAQEKQKKLSQLTEQLDELEDANTVLSENMQEIRSMEKTIKEKIEHIND